MTTRPHVISCPPLRRGCLAQLVTSWRGRRLRGIRHNVPVQRGSRSLGLGSCPRGTIIIVIIASIIISSSFHLHHHHHHHHHHLTTSPPPSSSLIARLLTLSCITTEMISTEVTQSAAVFHIRHHHTKQITVRTSQIYPLRHVLPVAIAFQALKRS